MARPNLRVSACGALLLAATALLACDRTAVETWLAEGSGASSGPSLLTRGPFETAESAFRGRIGKNIRALSLLVYPDHAVLQAQNPSNATQVEQWIYRGGVVSDPVPVELLGTGKLADNLFKLSDAKLSALPELVVAAQKRAQIPEGSVARVLLKRNLPESTDVRFRVYVTSQRRDGFVDADAEGHIITAPEPPAP